MSQLRDAEQVLFLEEGGRVKSKVTDSVILSWGIAYLAVTFVKPDIVSGVPLPCSAVPMFVIGVLMVTNVLVFKNKAVFAALGVFEAVGMVASWTGFVTWNTVLSRTVAQSSMAVMDWIASIALFSKVIDDGY